MNFPSILVVDDDLDDQSLIENALSDKGFTDVALFSDAVSALQYLSFEAKKLPKLIISDFNMPKLTGLEFLERVKNSDRLKAIPFVILSTSKLESLHLNFLALGGQGYYQKPNDYLSFLKLIEDVVQANL